MHNIVIDKKNVLEIITINKDKRKESCQIGPVLFFSLGWIKLEN